MCFHVLQVKVTVCVVSAVTDPKVPTPSMHCASCQFMTAHTPQLNHLFGTSKAQCFGAHIVEQ